MRASRLRPRRPDGRLHRRRRGRRRDGRLLLRPGAAHRPRSAGPDRLGDGDAVDRRGARGAAAGGRQAGGGDLPRRRGRPHRRPPRAGHGRGAASGGGRPPGGAPGVHRHRRRPHHRTRRRAVDRVLHAWATGTSPGICRLAGDERVFRIDRIRDLQPTGDRFEPPAETPTPAGVVQPPRRRRGVRDPPRPARPMGHRLLPGGPPRRRGRGRVGHHPLLRRRPVGGGAPAAPSRAGRRAARRRPRSQTPSPTCAPGSWPATGLDRRSRAPTDPRGRTGTPGDRSGRLPSYHRHGERQPDAVGDPHHLGHHPHRLRAPPAARTGPQGGRWRWPSCARRRQRAPGADGEHRGAGQAARRHRPRPARRQGGPESRHPQPRRRRPDPQPESCAGTAGSRGENRRAGIDRPGDDPPGAPDPPATGSTPPPT